MTLFFLLIILGCHRQARTAGLRAHRHRSRADTHSSDQHPGHQHVGQPGPEHGRGLVRRRLGVRQLWLFWLAPIVGALLGAFAYRTIAGPDA